MDIIQIIQQKVSQLAPNQQQEVLDFADFLAHKHQPVTAEHSVQSRRSAAGYLAHLNVHITREDITEIRREMWNNLPEH
jgi:hypothetical protein